MTKPPRDPLTTDPGAAARELRAVLAQVEERMTQVEAQAGTTRELLAQVRGATKDLGQAVKDSRTAYQGLAEEAMKRFIVRDLATAQDGVARAMAAAEKRVLSRFDALYNVLMTGHVNGRPGPGQVNLEQAVVVEAVARFEGFGAVNGTRDAT